MRVDATPESFSEFGPGIYLAEVKACEVRHTSEKTGSHPYYNVRLHDGAFAGDGGLIAFDNILLAGRGRSIGIAKLKALGFEEVMGDDGKPFIDVEPEDLVGRRVWVMVGEDEYGGKVRLKVLTEFEPKFSCGYWHEKHPPEEAGSDSGLMDPDDSVPF